jgi:hypothetical protein
MERIFHPYYEWEDYQAGMYDELKQGREYRVMIAKELLADPPILKKFMKEVTIRWTKASEHNLTNNGCNRKAWLGQAACCLYAGVKEDETREGWKQLTKEQMKEANEQAKQIIIEWEKIHEENVRTQCI